jgi:predicted porin
VGTSNLGFRGGIDLFDNLSVIWQVESGVQFDGTPAANTVASRNSNVGLTGSWGTAFVGSWDTPFKWAGVSTINPLRAGFISDYNGILSGPGFGIATVVTQPGRVNAAADAAFERRQGNSIQYWSPSFHGAFARLAVSLDEGRTGDSAMAVGIRPAIFSGLVGYDGPSLKLRYALEAHFDYFGLSQQGGSPGATATNRSSTDLGHRLIATYTNKVRGFDTRLVGVFEYLSYKNDDTNPMNPRAVNEHSRAAYYGLLDQTLLGKSHVWVAFGRALDGSCSLINGEECSTNGLGANMGVLGYLYRVSKDTDFYAVGYRITNKFSASYSTFPALGGPAATGADVQGVGIGMLYQFSATVLKGSKRALHPTPAPPPAAPVPTPAPDVTPGPTPEPAPAPAPAAPPGPTAPPAPAPAP